MSRRPRLHPLLPLPPDGRRELVLVAQLALNELREGQPGQALIDLYALATVVGYLVADNRVSDEAREAFMQAARGLESHRAGEATGTELAAECEAMIDVFEQLLQRVPLKRLRAAQAVAESGLQAALAEA